MLRVALAALGLLAIGAVGATSDLYQRAVLRHLATGCFARVDCTRVGESVAPESIVPCTSLQELNFQNNRRHGAYAEFICSSASGKSAILIMTGSPFGEVGGGWARCDADDCASALQELRWRITASRR